MDRLYFAHEHNNVLNNNITRSCFGRVSSNLKHRQFSPEPEVGHPGRLPFSDVLAIFSLFADIFGTPRFGLINLEKT